MHPNAVEVPSRSELEPGTHPLRIREMATYLRVSHPRMYAEGKLIEPEQIDGVGPL